MAITLYSELQTAVQAWLMGRTDLATYAPDFIALAEGWLNYGTDSTEPLRVPEMEAITDLVPVGGAAQLPADFLQYIRVVPYAAYRAPLDWIAPNLAPVMYPSGASGVSSHFTVIGTTLYSYPLSTEKLTLVYYQAIPPLATAAGGTNWLLTKSPGIYLRAALAQAAEFIKDDNEAAKQFEMARALVAGLNKSAMLGRYGRAGISFRGVVA